MTHGIEILDALERRGIEREHALTAAQQAVAERLADKRRREAR